MIRWLAASVATATFAATALHSQSHAQRTAAPLRPIDAKAYATTVASNRGHVLIVDFWATWCSSCREEMPSVIALAKQYSRYGVRLVTVSADEPAQLREAERFLDSVRAPAKRYLKRANDDDAFISAIDSAWTGALPALFVYDRAGRKVRALVGETAIDTLAAIVRVTLAAEPKHR